MSYSNSLQDKLPRLDKHFLCIKSIIIGSFIAIGLSFLFNLLNVGVGISAYQSQSGNISLAVGGFIWLLIGSCITMLIVGWATSLLSQTSCKIIGIIHGFSAWCLSLSILLFITLYALKLTTESLTTLITSMPFTSLLTHSINTWANPPVKYTAGGIWAFFIIFLIGAFASCIGGYFGATANRHKLSHNA